MTPYTPQAQATATANPQPHGVRAFFWSNGSEYLPAIECDCGWESSRSCIYWAEAGEEYDQHLQSIR